MATPGNHNNTVLGTAAGTLLSLTACINSGDVIKTSILAAVGACVSFIISILLRKITQYFKQ